LFLLAELRLALCFLPELGDLGTRLLTFLIGEALAFLLPLICGLRLCLCLLTLGALLTSLFAREALAFGFRLRVRLRIRLLTLGGLLTVFFGALAFLLPYIRGLRLGLPLLTFGGCLGLFESLGLLPLPFLPGLLLVLLLFLLFLGRLLGPLRALFLLLTFGNRNFLLLAAFCNSFSALHRSRLSSESFWHVLACSRATRRLYLAMLPDFLALLNLLWSILAVEQNFLTCLRQ
jgi:hypothetical protein